MQPTLEQQKQYYTERWREEGANSLGMARIAKVLERISELNMPRNARICDLGCGPGWTTNILSMFGEATGVDLSDVTLAQEKYPHCRFVSANAIGWRSDLEGQCDLVVSVEVLEHIEDHQQNEYLSVAKRLLKPGGYLILTTPNKRTLNAIQGGGRSYSNQPVENWLSSSQLGAMLRRAGFTVDFKGSMILGMGTLGSYRLANSYKLQRALGAIGLLNFWKSLLLRANYGLHLIAVASLPARTSR